MIYLKRSMGEQRKKSLISLQINWKPGVEMTLLEVIFASNRVTVGEPESKV